MFTTIRELVENGLDGAEGMMELPHIVITVNEITKKEFNQSLGMRLIL